MALKKHHKVLIGSFSSLVIMFMIVSGILIYLLFVQQTVNYNKLNQKIVDTQSSINTLTDNLIQTKSALEETVSSLDLKVGSIGEEMDVLKASAGEDFSGVIENSIKSVVTIRTDISQGTGFLIGDEGYIVTNYHVMEGANQVGIFTYDGEMHSTTFLGYDSQFDIALLKIEGNFDALTLADSEDITVGENVIAIGNPLGLQFSVSEGIVSATHRLGPNEIEAYVQTDAALNPGNSGGPLINKQGEVVGINNFKIGEGESLGFALESNYIEEVVNEISQEVLNISLV